MPLSTTPEWHQLALYAFCAALLLIFLMRLPYVGRLVSGVLSLGMLALLIFVLLQQAPYVPTLSAAAQRLGLSRQEVAGDEVRIRMAHDGHFWAEVSINGAQRRMLVDSGATVTALSPATARAAGIDAETTLMPAFLRTANGTVQAHTAEVDVLQLGSIEARSLPVVISPALGGLDVIGMNFLSELASWRVEGRTLVLVPDRAPARGG